MQVALTVGLALTALAIVLVMSRSPLEVAGTNSAPANGIVEYVQGGSSRCQISGTVPRDTSAIRISVTANVGPQVTLKVLSGPLVITSGRRVAGWGVQESVTVPVKRVLRTIPNAEICMAFGPSVRPIIIHGAAMPAATVVTFRVEYLRPGPVSWWSLASTVARHMGFGHAASGTWIVFALLVVMLAVAVLASRLILRELSEPAQAVAQPPAKPSTRMPAAWVQRLATRVRGGRLARLLAGSGVREQAGEERGRTTRSSPGKMLRRIPRAAWICALIACLNAACWSVITPPFQAPDEPSHFAYVQHLAETRTLPASAGSYSEAEEVALRDLHHLEVRWHPELHPVATAAEQQRLEDDLAQPLDRTDGASADVAAAQPPLYYALQAIPYWLGSGGTLLDQLELMRLLSALLGGVTAFFAYMFVREALPTAPWAWAVGGLSVAMTPLLGFISGVVNPDAMLAAVSAAILYCLARAFRRGLTARLAIVIGVLTAIGFLTKVNFIGLAPGVIVGLVILTRRAARTSGRTAYRSLALALAIAASPVYVYIVINVLSNRSGLGIASSAIHLTSGHGSVLDEISYIWQFFLPRLPGMTNDFPGIFPLRQIWFDRFIGLYGWMDTPFPVWVYNVALIPTALLIILGIRELIKGATALRRRLVELAIYALMCVGVLALVGADSYLEFPPEAGNYGEARYLLPLLPLLGAALVLSARGAGRRWGPAVGTLIVVLFLAHDVFSQLQVIGRFYI